MVAVETEKGDANCVMLAMFNETVLPPGTAMESAVGEGGARFPVVGSKVSV